MKFILFFCLLLISFDFKAQVKISPTLSNHILSKEFSEYRVMKSPKRKILNLKNSSFTTKINPLTYLSVGLIFVYQNIFSEQIAAKCSYEISCSEFTKKAIEKHGLILGAFIGFHQLSNCIPKIAQEYPEYLISDDELINNKNAF